MPLFVYRRSSSDPTALLVSPFPPSGHFVLRGPSTQGGKGDARTHLSPLAVVHVLRVTGAPEVDRTQLTCSRRCHGDVSSGGERVGCSVGGRSRGHHDTTGPGATRGSGPRTWSSSRDIETGTA